MKATIFGEILFDNFPNNVSVAGGAPFNVAWHLNALDANVNFISRIGSDDAGKQLTALMLEYGLGTQNIQVDSVKPTGYVNVAIENGEPSYQIGDDVAYDAIEPPSKIEKADILYHGTLALRHSKSAQALDAIRKQANLVFMDVNLRDPHWDKSKTLALAAKSNWLKLNADEFKALTSTVYSSDAAIDFINKLELDGLLVTLGAKGACVYTKDQSHCTRVIPKLQDNIQDTVGAGDAFSAIFIFGLIQNWPMQAILSRAQAFASQIITIPGATTTDHEFYLPFKQAWQTQ